MNLGDLSGVVFSLLLKFCGVGSKCDESEKLAKSNSTSRGNLLIEACHFLAETLVCNSLGSLVALGHNGGGEEERNEDISELHID